MRALLYSDWETLEMTDVPVPEPGSGEVRIKVEAAGICGSELEAFRKRSPRRQPPLILGHEYTGVIEQVGPGVQDWKEGDAVVPNAVIACGTCASCRRGQSHLCLNRQLFGMHRPGAFAEFVNAPVGTLIRRPSRASASAAALTEPLANGIHVANLLEEVSPAQVIVFGAGPIGLLSLLALKITFGAQIAMIDRSETRLGTAKAVGADAVFLPDEQEKILDWISSEGLPATVDAVGAESTKAASVSLLRPGGTALWIGLHENTSPMNAYDVILAEKRLLGSYACSQKELAQALEWIADGKVDVSTWVSKYPLEESVNAFNTMLRPGPNDVKGVITML
jgi:threonine dehydrogenase-like Zn-dependent dehydrogenase